MFSWPEKLVLAALALNAVLMSYIVYDSVERELRMEEQTKIEALWKEAIRRCLAD